MPDITTCCQCSHPFIIGGNFNPVNDTFRSHNLVRAHHHQHTFRSEHTILGQNIQKRMLRKKCFGKINKIGNHLIIGSSPIGSKLKTVTGLLGFLLSVLMLFDSAEPRSIGIILGMGAVRNHKDLHIFIQTSAGPKAVPLIPVNLIESFFQRYAPAFQFHMH